MHFCSIFMCIHKFSATSCCFLSPFFFAVFSPVLQHELGLDLYLRYFYDSFCMFLYMFALIVHFSLLCYFVFWFNFVV